MIMWDTEEMLRAGGSVYATVLLDMSYRESFHLERFAEFGWVFFMNKDDLQQLKNNALTTN